MAAYLRGRKEDERITVAQVLPFCPSPSWYVSYWFERADAPRSAGRFGRLAARLAQQVIAAARDLRRRRPAPAPPPRRSSVLSGKS